MKFCKSASVIVMKSKRFAVVVAILSALSLFVAACGDDDNDGGATENTAVTSGSIATSDSSAIADSPTTSLARQKPQETQPSDSPTTRAETDGSDSPAIADSPTTLSSILPADVPAPADVQELKLGYILPQTGSLAYLVDAMEGAVNLAVEEINREGIQRIDMLAGDSGTNSDVANNTADNHLAEGVQGIVGAGASAVSLAIIDKITGVGIPMISPSNTSPAFTTYDDGGLYFRTIASDVLQGRMIADLITDDGARRVAIMYRADAYGEALADASEKGLINNGVESAGKFALDPEGSTFASEVQEVAASGADAVILIAFDEGGRIVAEMIEARIGPRDIDIYVTAGLAVDDLWELVNPDDPSFVQGIRGTRIGESESGEQTFRERFAEFAPGVDDAYAPEAYDAVVIYALAALVADSNRAEDFAAEINGVTRDGTKCSLYADCAELIMAGEDIDYEGAAGSLDFVEAGEPSVATFDILEFDEAGEIVVVSSRTLRG